MENNKKLILRAVDPKKVIDSIFSDPNYSVPISKVNLKLTEVTHDIAFGDSPESDVYEYTDSQNRRIRTFCLDHNQYTRMKQSNDYDESCLKNLNIKCDWCRQAFNDIPWKIPLNVDSNGTNGCVYFLGEGAYCSKECMYADYTELFKFKYGSNKYQEVHTYIMYLCRLKGESFPVPAPHWKLHQNNGGSLTDNDYRSNKTVYKSEPNIVILPIKRQYNVIK